MNRFILLLTLFVFSSGYIFAEEMNVVQVGDLVYRLNEKTMTAKVTYNIDKEGDNYAELPNYVEIPTSIQVSNDEYVVSAIGVGAFEACEKLYSITLPITLKEIEESAFSGSSIISIELPEGIEEISGSLFSYTQLESITLPSTVKTIGDFAFYSCGKLKEIQIPDKLESIGKSAFRECNALESLTFTNIREIGDKAFKDCQSLNEVNFGKGELTIGNEAFADCPALASLSFGTGVVEIGESAFSECEALTEITIPKNIQKIGYCAFYNCMGLSSVTLEDGDTKLLLGSSPFANCPFTYLYLGRNIGQMNDNSFPSSFFLSNKNLEKIVIGDSVTYIPQQLFRNSQSLKEVSFGNNVKEVSADGFADCSNLKRVDCKSIDNWSKINFEDASSNPLSNGAKLYVDDQLVIDIRLSSDVKAIGNNAFAQYSPLKTVEISESVESIGIQAFFGCENLESVVVESGKKEYGDGAFLRCSNLREVYCSNIIDWIESTFNNLYSNPIGHDTLFYLDGEILETLDIPEGPHDIGKNCFNRYDFITSVKIPESVVTVGDYAFADCNNLEDVFLGSKVSEIGGKAFSSLSIKTIISKATLSPSFSTNSTTATFMDYNAEVFVPNGSLESYRENECWKNFSKIEEKDFSGVEIVESDGSNGFKIEGNTLYAFENLEVFTVSGIKIAEISANATLTLTPGITYIIHCKGKTKKVMRIK